MYVRESLRDVRDIERERFRERDREREEFESGYKDFSRIRAHATRTCAWVTLVFYYSCFICSF